MPEIFIVSDGTGATAETVLKAALTQFPETAVHFRRFAHVRTETEIRDIVAQAGKSGSPVLYTLVMLTLRQAIMQAAQTHRVRSLDLLGPIMSELADLLQHPPSIQPGRFRQINGEHFRGTETMEYMLQHDDGKHSDGLHEAEIVLVGISRTYKTPVSVYLAYRGWRVANVPLAVGVEPPPSLFDVNPAKIVGLTISPERLVTLRRARIKAMSKNMPNIRYADIDYVQSELAQANLIFRRPPRWPVVDVTAKSIEEVAAEIVDLVRERQARANSQ